MRYLLIILTLLQVNLAFTCSCVWEISEFTPRDYINYDVIFDGELDTIYDRGKYKILPFTVLRNFKSADVKVIDVVLYGTTCDATLLIGKKYRIFGKMDSGPFYYVSKCGHTHELSSSERESNGGNEVFGTNLSDTLTIPFNGKFIRKTAQEFDALLDEISIQQDSLVRYLSSIDSAQIITHYLNGQISARGTFTGGKPQGLWTFYYPDGRVLATGRYNFGLKNGYWVEYFNEELAGYAVRKGNYIGGRECGKWELFDVNEQLIREKSFTETCK